MSQDTLLLVYGNWREIERSIGLDKQNLQGLESASSLFDGRLSNTFKGDCRVEDSVLISLAKLEGSR